METRVILADDVVAGITQASQDADIASILVKSALDRRLQGNSHPE
ncbi:MAG: hypothetical protein ACLFWD_10435 [Anaerolineales bacterium]